MWNQESSDIVRFFSTEEWFQKKKKKKIIRNTKAKNNRTLKFAVKKATEKTGVKKTAETFDIPKTALQRLDKKKELSPVSVAKTTGAPSVFSPEQESKFVEQKFWSCGARPVIISISGSSKK